MAMKAQEALDADQGWGTKPQREDTNFRQTSMIRGIESGKRREVSGGLRLKEELARGARHKFSWRAVISRICGSKNRC
jgi:hypothetical protein